jgi:hypothetical protein
VHETGATATLSLQQHGDAVGSRMLRGRAR